MENLTVYSLGHGAWLSKQAGVEHAMKSRHDILDYLKINNKIIITDFIVEVENENVISITEYFQGSPREKENLPTFNTDGLNYLRTENGEVFLDNLGNKKFLKYEEHGNTLICEFFNTFNITHILTKRGYYIQNVNGIYYYFNNKNEIILIKDIAKNEYILKRDKKVNVLNHNEFVSYFLNEFLNDGDMLIHDRNIELEDLPRYLKKGIKNILPIHNNHVANNDIKKTRQMNNFYTYILNNHEFFDAIITSTEEQARDIKDRFKCEATCIPVGFVDEKNYKLAVETKEEDRLENSALMFTRLAPDKQVHLIIDMFKKVVDEIPNATLGIYGFPNAESDGRFLGLELIYESIEKNNLQDNVVIGPYFGSKDEVYDIERKGQLYLLGSKAEGFNLGLMEGISSGLIGISTDVKYGPAELIDDKNTGYLLEYNDFDKMAEVIIDLFKNKEKLKEMRKRSLKRVNEKYSKEVIAEKWQEVLNKLKGDI